MGEDTAPLICCSAFIAHWRQIELTKMTLPSIPMIVWLCYSLYTYVTYTVYLCVCKMCIYTHVCKRYIQIYLLYSFFTAQSGFILNSGIVTWRTPLAIICTLIVLLDQKEVYTGWKCSPWKNVTNPLHTLHKLFCQCLPRIDFSGVKIRKQCIVADFSVIDHFFSEICICGFWEKIWGLFSSFHNLELNPHDLVLICFADFFHARSNL